MTSDDKDEMLDKLVRMQRTLHSVKEACDYQAALCKEIGSTGMAFATLMVGEAVVAYSDQLARFVEDAVDG